MEYRPRYPQPFTLADAVQLDVSTITQEIARLQDSIRRLKETQTALQEIASSTPSGEVVDPEYERAIEENRVVIGSQEERISILQMALSEKGISPEHHELPSAQHPSRVTNQSPSGNTRVIHTEASGSAVVTDGGVYLDPKNKYSIDIVIEAVRAALMIQREDSTPELVGRANEEIVQAIQQLSNIPEMDCQFEQKVYDSLQYYIHELSFWIHMSVRRPLKTRRNAHQSRNVIENSRPSTTQEQLIARVLHLDTRIENDLGRIRPLNLSHVPHAISHSLLNSSSENARIRAKLLEQIHRHRESRSDSQRPNTTSLFNTISHIKQPVITLDSSLLAVKNSASQLVHSRLNLLFNSFLAELNCEMDAHWKASAEQMHYRLEPIDILLSALSGTAISP